MEQEVKYEKKPRTEKQKAATAKALEALKARRQMTQEMIDEKMTKHVDEAEERIAAKVLARLQKPVEEKKVVEKPVEKVVAEKPKKQKVVVVQEESSSSEEEVIIQRVKKTKAPAPVEEKKPVAVPVPVRTTGNKLLDRMYGFC